MMDDPDEAGNNYWSSILVIISSCLGSVDFSGAAIIVMWSCLLQLLTKCRREGCGAAVIPDNMVPQRNGEIYICKIWVQVCLRAPPVVKICFPRYFGITRRNI